MAISVNTLLATYTGDATTKDFALAAKCFATGDISVFVDGVLKTEVVDYEVTAPTGDFADGVNVTFVSAPANATVVSILRKLDETQTLSLSEGGTMSAAEFEAALDRNCILVQQTSARLERLITKLGTVLPI
jgi:hypothetical protein